MVDTDLELYNTIYTEKPDKWANPSRDLFAIDVLKKYGSYYNLLDIGCGNGHTLEAFKKQWPDAFYFGLDLSTKAIELAEERVPDASFICGRLEDDLLFPKTFCRILLLGVLEHFQDLPGALKIIKESLSPDGYIYIEAPNCRAFSHVEEEGFFQTKRGSGQVEWHLKRETWEKILRDAGFKIVESLRGKNTVTEFVWVLKI